MVNLTSLTGVLGVEVKPIPISGERAGLRLIVTSESLCSETGTIDLTFDLWSPPEPPPGSGIDSVLRRLCSSAANALGRDDVARAVWAQRPVVDQNVEPDTFDNAPRTGDWFEAWDTCIELWCTLRFDPDNACGVGWICCVTLRRYDAVTERFSHWRPIVPPLPFRGLPEAVRCDNPVITKIAEEERK